MKILLAIPISFTLQTTLVFSQTPSIQEMWFGKTAFYQQIGDKNPVLDPSHPYAFSSKCIINGGKLISASITSNDISYKYTKTGDNKSDIFSLFKTNEDLTSCFPSGNYTLQVISSNGSISEIINNENPFYPSPPRILSGNNTCWINEVLVITSKKLMQHFLGQVRMNRSMKFGYLMKMEEIHSHPTILVILYQKATLILCLSIRLFTI